MPPKTVSQDMLPLPQELKRLVPQINKSSGIRWVVKDALSPENTVVNTFLHTPENYPFGEDMEAAFRVSRQLKTGEPLEPGDSRTLLIMSRMLLYTKRIDRKIILTPMQERRNVEDDPAIADLPLMEMLKLSGGTTQWASAAILLQERHPDEIQKILQALPEEQRTMIRLTIDIKRRWLCYRALGRPFVITEQEKEQTLLRQASHYVTRLVTGANLPFKPLHSEDAIYAVMSGNMTLEEAAELFPMLPGTKLTV